MHCYKKIQKINLEVFFDNIDKWAKDQGASGLAYFTIEKDKEISAKGPVQGKIFYQCCFRGNNEENRR